MYVQFVIFLQLQRLEEEAREQMKQEMEKRRDAALKRREQNLERRSNLESVRQSQGLTRPWVFSYYVLWPRETYEGYDITSLLFFLFFYRTDLDNKRYLGS